MQVLLTRLQLRFVLRSLRSVWLGHPMLVRFELSLAHMCIRMQLLSRSSSGSNSSREMDVGTPQSLPQPHSPAHRDRKLQWELAWTDVLSTPVLTADGEHVDAPLVMGAGSAAATCLLCVLACPTKLQRKGKRSAQEAAPA